MITLDEFQEKQASARNVFECKRLVENKRHETAIATLLAELNESINAAWDEYLVWVGERKKELED